MARLEPTRQLALKVWWAFVWRAFLLVLLLRVAIVISFSFIGTLLHIPPESMETTANILGLGLGVAISVEVMFRLLRKKFKTFQIILATPDEG